MAISCKGQGRPSFGRPVPVLLTLPVSSVAVLGVRRALHDLGLTRGALVNTILGIQRLLYCTPPLYFSINIAQFMTPPPAPLCCHSAYNVGNENIV